MAVVDDIKAELTEALEEIEATTGSVNFLYSAVNYVCTPGVEDYRKELEEQGYLEEYDLTLKREAEAGAYDAVIAAVNHAEYAGYGEAEFRHLLRDGDGTVVDVKGVFRGRTGDLDYWSL